MPAWIIPVPAALQDNEGNLLSNQPSEHTVHSPLSKPFPTHTVALKRPDNRGSQDSALMPHGNLRETDIEELSEGSIAENHVDGATGVVSGAGRIKPVKNVKELAVIREKVNEQQRQMGKPTKPHYHPDMRPPSVRASSLWVAFVFLKTKGCWWPDRIRKHVALMRKTPQNVAESDMTYKLNKGHTSNQFTNKPCSKTPCQQELDQVLERISTMRLPDERGPLEHLYSLNIPNCDKQGLYNLKQAMQNVSEWPKRRMLVCESQHRENNPGSTNYPWRSRVPPLLHWARTGGQGSA
ncbi:hypothetical protein lerEdw1_003446 [Lerista edwardsae]|nr:hypothetical protein lerEdw1_003446 [Lerista edwardsae]